MKNTVNGVNVLICGSQNFDLNMFVMNVLDSYYELLSQKNSFIKKVYTSQYTGVCSFANEWVRNKNESLSSDYQIKQKDFSFQLLNHENGLSIYDELIIPEFILQNDPMFIQGKENIQKLNLQLVLVFPNQDGIIGAHSRNIMRFAELAGFKANQNIIDCSEILKSYLVKYMQKQKAISESDSQNQGTDKPSTILPPYEQNNQKNDFIFELKNRHKHKTFR